MSDPVNHPDHYTCYEHEVIELTKQLDFCMGNVCKYILRADHKGKPVQDLEKAQWYLNAFRTDNPNTDFLSTYGKDFRKLAESYKCPLIIAVLSDQTEAAQALETTILKRKLEAVEKALEEEKAKHVDQTLTLRELLDKCSKEDDTPEDTFRKFWGDDKWWREPSNPGYYPYYYRYIVE